LGSITRPRPSAVSCAGTRPRCCGRRPRRSPYSIGRSARRAHDGAPVDRGTAARAAGRDARSGSDVGLGEGVPRRLGAHGREARVVEGGAGRKLVDLLLAPEGFTRGPDCGAYCLPCAEGLAYEVDVEPDRAGVTAL